MSRDKFDNILRKKLADSYIEPPAGVWSRLEKELATVAATHSETKDAQVPVAKLDRRRKQWMAYAAAASVLIAAGVIGIQYVVQPMLTEQTQLAVEQGRFAMLDSAYAVGEVASHQQTPMAVEPTRRAAAPTRPLAVAAHRSVPQSEIKTATISNFTPDTSTSETVPEKQSKVEQQPTKAEQPAQAKSKAQADEQNRRQIEWNRMMQQQKKSKRNSRGINTSLYAANYGGGINGQEVSNPATLATTSLKVQEVMQNDGSSLMPNSYKRTVTDELTHKMPISVGVSVGIGLGHNLTLETGLTYTGLYSEAKTKGVGSYKLNQDLHYLGVPVALLYNIADGRRAGLYARAGGAVERCISATRTVNTSGENGMSSRHSSKMNVDGVQFSVGAALGGELKLTKNLGLYVEPGVGYFFENNSQPESYRSENPVNFTLKAGLRIKIK